MREAIFRYVKETYKTEPDYPFSTAPTYPVLRHADNRKWFALLMDVSREKLGLKGTEHVDIINVKLGIRCSSTCSSGSRAISTATISPGATGSPSCWTAPSL